MSVFDVAVIGLGAMGSAALCHLAGRGQKVVGIEQFQPGHERGSSHGESRAIRLGYSEKPFYVPLVRRAFENWRDLERQGGEQVLFETGLIEIGPAEGAVVKGTLLACQEHGLDCEMLEAAQIKRRFPAFVLPPDHVAILQPKQNGGFVDADRANAAHLRLARQSGATILTGLRVLAFDPRGDAIRLVLGGETIEAKRVVLCTGGWINELLADPGLPLTLTRQVICWFEPKRPELFALGRLPVFFVEGENDGVYGFPYRPGHGFKCASHLHGATLSDARSARQDAAPEDEASIREFLERSMPEAAGRLIAMKTCLYTNTPDEDFVIDLLPSDPRIVVASACSGHGFKFASVIGEILADLAIVGSTDHDISRFRMDRFAAQDG